MSTAESQPSSGPIRFGIFEVDLRSGELRRNGYRVKLQDQPLRVLAILLDRAGDVVTREELQAQLWPDNTFVDFDRAVNGAINRLRAALGDNADNPRFIETVPRRGYRFLAPIETDAPPAVAAPEANRFPVETLNPSTKASLFHSKSFWGVVSAFLCLAIAAYWRPWSGDSARITDRPFLQFDLDVGPDQFSQPAISPDGLRMAVVSQGALAIRRFDQTKTMRLAGTEGGFLPFFSPDGKWLGFFAKGTMQKVAIEGGAPVVLCPAPSPGGATWGDDNTIVAVPIFGAGLSRIPATGGLPQALTNAQSDPSGVLMHLWPQTLPDGAGVLFAATDGSEKSSLRVLKPDGAVVTVVEDASRGCYLPSGYLVYWRRRTLLAARFDLRKARVVGRAIPLQSGVVSPGTFGRPEFDLSPSGTLIYRGGSTGGKFVLSWLDPSGKAEPVLPEPGNFATPRLSPDGQQIAVSIIEENRQNVWAYHLNRQTWTRVSSGAAADFLPTWTPDGEYLAFRSGNKLAWIRSDGTGAAKYLNNASGNVGPSSFSEDGKWLAFWPLQPNSDLWAVPVVRSPGSLDLGRPHPVVTEAGSKGAPDISPDGRWLAYTSGESGRFEIYVKPFHPAANESAGKWTVSNGGGVCPRWARNGRELFFQTLDQHLLVAEYRARGNAFVPEKPRAWSTRRLGDSGIFAAYDLAPDGRRVLAILDSETAKPETVLHVLLNVEDEVRRRLGRNQ